LEYWVASLLGFACGAAGKLLPCSFVPGWARVVSYHGLGDDGVTGNSSSSLGERAVSNMSRCQPLLGTWAMGSMSTVHMLARSPYAGLRKGMAQCPVSSMFPQKETSSECDSLQAVVRMMCDARAPVVARW
jgi:hypothetical protein